MRRNCTLDFGALEALAAHTALGQFTAWNCEGMTEHALTMFIGLLRGLHSSQGANIRIGVRPAAIMQETVVFLGQEGWAEFDADSANDTPLTLRWEGMQSTAAGGADGPQQG